MELGKRNSVLIERMLRDVVAPIGQLTTRFPHPDGGGNDGGDGDQSRICRTISRTIARESRTRARWRMSRSDYEHPYLKFISESFPVKIFLRIFIWIEL